VVYLLTYELLSNFFLLSQEPGAKCVIARLTKSSFAVIEHAKITKEFEKLIMSQKVVGVFRIADSLLIDQIGLEDHPRRRV
jgi:hypothetical protein